MKKLILIALMAAWSISAQAFDLGKLIDIGKKVVQSNEDIDQPHETQMGADLAARVLSVTPVVNDPELQRYVNHVGMWLAQQSERPDLNWRFCVVDSTSINAMSMPGGYIIITKGLFDRLRSESELAGVLGHEISHAVKKHQLKAIQKALGKSAGADALQIWADQKGSQGSQIAANIAKAGMDIYTHGLDKSDEFEADRLGVVVAARGGYSPYGLVGVLQTLSLEPKNSDLALLLATHPNPTDRIDQLAAAMGDKLDDLPNKVDDVPRFAKFKH